MRVPVTWLASLVRVPGSTSELAERLTVAGLAVEAAEEVGRVDPAVVAGRIEHVERHPESERLAVCRLAAAGEGSPLRIVSAAPGLRRGQIVAVARPGARLASGVAIEAKTFRGVESEGVLCSAAELGLGDDADRVLELPRGTRAGAPLVDVPGVRDTVLTLDVTPNRGDCLSMLGIAREVAAATGTRLRRPTPRIRVDPSAEALGVALTVEDPAAAPRYMARLVHGVRPAASPLWLRLRLERAGMRSIDAIVDAANHVMLESGQPLHTFDRARLVGARIVVRRARADETIETLDGVTRRLEPSDLVIADDAGPVALAGVMGGSRAAVSEGTTSVLLESAHFDPAVVRRTSRRLGLSSEASYRFERHVDPAQVRPALDSLVSLLGQLTGARALPIVLTSESPAHLPKPRSISMRPGRVAGLLGVDLSNAVMRRRLRSIGATARSDRGDVLVTPPSYRPDLTIEADLVEEVARVGGYDAIPVAMPVVPIRSGRDTSTRQLASQVREGLAAQGMSEAVTSPFLPVAVDETVTGWIGRALAPVVLRNPLSAEHAVLRRTPLGSLLRCLRLNADRGADFVGLFEIGKGFGRAATGERRERVAVAVVLGGTWPARGVEREGPPVEFGDVKGVIERLARRLGIDAATRFEVPAGDALPGLWHPTRSAIVSIDGANAGAIGSIHPRVAQVLEISAKTQVAEVDFQALCDYRPPRSLRPLPRYPAITRDIAVVVEEEFRSQAVLEEIGRLNHPLIESARLFDCYRGDPIAEGKKSLAFTIAYRAADRTLTDEEVGEAHDVLRGRLTARFALDLRS